MSVAQIMINGRERETDRERDVINPANETEVIGKVAMGTKEDVDVAIASAEAAFPSWSDVPLQDKVNMAKKVVELLRPRVEELTSLFVRESGKTLVEAKIDVSRSIDVIAETPDALASWYDIQDYSSDVQKVKLLRRPRGVTAIITPWNSPVILTMKRVMPALLTGNTLVVKPPTNCPLTIVEILKVLTDCFPPGVINTVTGSGGDIGDALIADERIKTISFVGGTETGKRIMELSAFALKRLHLELGGNDPAIILEDALLDRDNITKIKNGILRNAGQVCSAIKRIYVHESKYEELLEKLAKAFAETVVGEGIHPDATMGPLNNKNQYDFVQSLIEHTKREGGVVTHYGQKLNEEKWDKGYYMLPAIVTNVEQTSRIVQEEQFGPVIPILPFANIDDVIEKANDSPFGLRASIWTEDEAKALELSRKLVSGAIFHNNHTIFKDLRLDFPGSKQSGLGSETLHNGFEHFTDAYGFAN